MGDSAPETVFAPELFQIKADCALIVRETRLYRDLGRISVPRDRQRRPETDDEPALRNPTCCISLNFLLSEGRK